MRRLRTALGAVGAALAMVIGMGAPVGAIGVTKGGVVPAGMTFGCSSTVIRQTADAHVWVENFWSDERADLGVVPRLKAVAPVISGTWIGQPGGPWVSQLVGLDTSGALREITAVQYKGKPMRVHVGPKLAGFSDIVDITMGAGYLESRRLYGLTRTGELVAWNYYPVRDQVHLRDRAAAGPLGGRYLIARGVGELRTIDYLTSWDQTDYLYALTRGGGLQRVKVPSRGTGVSRLVLALGGWGAFSSLSTARCQDTHHGAMVIGYTPGNATENFYYVQNHLKDTPFVRLPMTITRRGTHLGS